MVPAPWFPRLCHFHNFWISRCLEYYIASGVARAGGDVTCGPSCSHTNVLGLLCIALQWKEAGPIYAASPNVRYPECRGLQAKSPLPVLGLEIPYRIAPARPKILALCRFSVLIVFFFFRKGLVFRRLFGWKFPPNRAGWQESGSADLPETGYRDCPVTLPDESTAASRLFTASRSRSGACMQMLTKELILGECSVG